MHITDDDITAIRSLNVREPALQVCLAGFIAAALRCPPEPIIDVIRLFVRATQEHPDILSKAQILFNAPEDKPQKRRSRA